MRTSGPGGHALRPMSLRTQWHPMRASREGVAVIEGGRDGLGVVCNARALGINGTRRRRLVRSEGNDK